MHHLTNVKSTRPHAYVTQTTDTPAIFLVERDLESRSALAAGLRSDGMYVIEFARSAEALAAVSNGGRPAVLVITPEGDGVTDCELACQAKAASPQTNIVLTYEPCGAPKPTPEFHALVKPFKPSKLSRFIRLVVAKPALRGTLQSAYRRAHSSSARQVP